MAEVFQCKFCKKPFFNERAFMKHECTAMRRSHEIQTRQGTMAYAFYKHWLEKQRRQAPPVETFITSSYYTSFFQFAAYCLEQGLPDPMKYVELMVDEKISPALWRRPEAYQRYLEYIDRRSDPYEQVNIAVETVLALSEGLGVAPAEVFKTFKPAEMIELIHQRRLTPWMLFCSRSFKNWASGLHDTDRRDLMRIIGVDYWSSKLERAPEVVKNIKMIVEELGI